MSAFTRMTIAGKQADVVFLDAQWAPTTSGDATLAKVIFDDGHVSFFTPNRPTTRGNPNHLPGGTPAGGQFASGPAIDHGADPEIASNVLYSPGRQLGGSNGARVYKGKDGVARIVKLYGEAGQGQDESLANDLYRRLDIPAPESFTFEHDGDTYYAAPMIPGVSAQRELGNLGLTKERADTVLNGFGADVLTANWDTAGLTLDNLVETPDGKIVRVDNGAAFLFRAMGERKPESMLNTVTEWESFAPGGRNRSYAKIFDAAGAARAEDIPTIGTQIDRIVELRDKLGGWQKYVTAKTPNMRADDRMKIIQMLDARTEFLIQKRAHMVARAILRDNQHHLPAGSPGGTGGQFTSAEGAVGGGSIEDAKTKVDAAKAKADATVGEITHQSAIKAWDKATDAYIHHPENPNHYYPSEHENVITAKGTLDEAKAKVVAAQNEVKAAFEKQNAAWNTVHDEGGDAVFDKATDVLSKAETKLGQAQDAYKMHPENLQHLPSSEHEDVVAIAAAVKRPFETVVADTDAAQKAYKKANDESANISFDPTSTSDQKWAADAKAREAFQQYSALSRAVAFHPDNPINKNTAEIAAAASGSIPFADLKAKLDAAQTQKVADSNAYWKVGPGSPEGDVASQVASTSAEAYEHAKAVYEAHPEHPKNQPFETVVAARDATLKEYQDKLSAMAPDSGAAYEKYKELKAVVEQHPGNPDNMSYDDLVSLKDELDQAHDAAVDETRQLVEEGAPQDKIDAANAKSNAAYEKWSKVNDLVYQHPENPDNVEPETETDQYGNEIEKDEYGNTIEKDQYGNPVEYDDDNDPIEKDQYGNRVSTIDTHYCSGCVAAEETLGGYTATGHERINGFLRQAKSAYSSSNASYYQGQVDEIDAAIASTPPLAEPLVVWRGANAIRLGYTDRDALEGEAFTDLGFTSTSTSHDISENFGANSGYEHRVGFKITVPKGTRVLDFVRSGVQSASGEEDEVLLPRGGIFEIGKKTSGDKKYSWRESYPEYDVIYHPAEEHWVQPHRDQLSLQLKSNIRLTLQWLRSGSGNPWHDPKDGRFTSGPSGDTAEREWASWNDVSAWEETTPQHVNTKYCPDCGTNYGAIVHYVQDGHRPMNSLLRSGETGKSLWPGAQWKTADEYPRYISGLDAAIASTPATKHDMVVYRGVNIDKLGSDALQVGETFEDKGFASTSKDLHIALAGFSHTTIKTEGTVFAIRVPKGNHVLDVSKATPRAAEAIEAEREVLLPRGGKYKITRSRVAKDFTSKYRLIEMTYEPPTTTLANLNTRGNPYPHDPANGRFTGPGGGSGTAVDDFPVGATSNIINPPSHATHYKDPGAERFAEAKKYCPECRGSTLDAVSLDIYTGSGHEDINALARGKSGTSEWDQWRRKDAETHAAALDRLIVSTPPTEEKMTVYRGMNSERLGFTSLDEMPGKTVEDTGFASSSKSVEIAADFARKRGPKMVVLKIEIPKDVHVLDLARAGKGVIEQEVIFPRGGQFEITRRIGTHVIYGDPSHGITGVEIPVFAVKYHPPVSK